jgi:hypothetical protein
LKGVNFVKAVMSDMVAEREPIKRNIHSGAVCYVGWHSKTASRSRVSALRPQPGLQKHGCDPLWRTQEITTPAIRSSATSVPARSATSAGTVMPHYLAESRLAVSAANPSMLISRR